MKKQNKSRSTLSIRAMSEIRNEKVKLPEFKPRVILRKGG